MGNLKDQALKNETEDIQEHKLLDNEANYLRTLNLALQFNTFGEKILSGFLYYVCVQRLGYKEGTNLQFEFDFNKGDNILTVKLLPENPAAAQAAVKPEVPAE